jgi:hypothetical protein
VKMVNLVDMVRDADFSDLNYLGVFLHVMAIPLAFPLVLRMVATHFRLGVKDFII